MMAEYFITDYLNLEHGSIYLFGNYFIAGCVPLLLGDYTTRKPRWKSLLFLALQILGCPVVTEFFAAVYYAIFGDDTYVPFVCGLLVLAIYAVFFRKNKITVRLMRSSAFHGLSTLALCTTMSIGGVLGVPYHYLQWVLITLNGIMIGSAFFIKKSA